LNHFDERFGASIENGQLKVVEFHDGVVDAQADQRGEQMLGGRDEDALFHQAGGITHTGDVPADGLNLKTIKVGAAEDNAGA